MLPDRVMACAPTARSWMLTAWPKFADDRAGIGPTRRAACVGAAGAVADADHSARAAVQRAGAERDRAGAGDAVHDHGAGTAGGFVGGREGDAGIADRDAAQVDRGPALAAVMIPVPVTTIVPPPSYLQASASAAPSR